MVRESILVTGASGLVGAPLAEHLVNRGYDVTGVGRSDSNAPNIQWLTRDLTRGLEPGGSYQIIVHAAPIWLLVPNLDMLSAAGITRIIAFSSTSSTSKQDSRSRKDRELAAGLVEAEYKCVAYCRENQIDLTIFRPTMIYGFGRDRNICTIAKTIRKLRCFPVAGRARGKRQPVHVLDLINAVVKSMCNQTSFGKTYTLTGADVLPYREMVEKVFVAMSIRPRILRLPVAVYKAFIMLASASGILYGITPAAADRMNVDLCFDHSPASRDFGYTGSSFLDHPARDLPN